MTEVKLPSPVKATLVEDIDEAEAIPGAIEFRSIDGKVVGLAFRCPCGCKLEAWLPIRDADSGTAPNWQWDGNRETPTLAPSILYPDHWHGYLRGGVWVQA